LEPRVKKTRPWTADGKLRGWGERWGKQTRTDGEYQTKKKEEEESGPEGTGGIYPKGKKNLSTLHLKGKKTGWLPHPPLE